MPEGIKFNSTSVETKSLRSGNIYFGIGDDPKGPTTLTGFKSAVDFGTSISLIALHRGDGVFSWYKAFTEQDIITFTNKIDLTGINLITNNPTPTTNTTGYAVVGGQGTLTFDSEQSAIRWIRTSYESWGAYVWNNSIQNYLFDKFSNYTITFEWKFGTSHTANQSYNFEIINGPGTYTILGNIGLTANSTLQESGWYRFTRTHTPLQDGVGQTIQYRIIRSTTVGTTDIYWRKLEYFKTTRTTKEQCYNYFAGQSDKIIFNKDYDPIITDGLVLNLDAGFLPSYPGTGSSWYDLGSGQSNGTLQNGPIFNSGGWINFDGSNDRCSIPNQTFNSTSNSSFTIEIIFKRNSSTPSSSTQLYRIGTGVSSTDARIFFWFDDNNNGSMRLNYYFSGGVDRYITLSNQLLDTNFHHSVQVIDKTNLEMVGYFDGINKGEGSILSSSTSDTNFLIGKSSGSVNASVALLKIYNRVLSQSEILQNYYQGPIVTDGLVFFMDPANLVSYTNTSNIAYSLIGGYNASLESGTTFSTIHSGVFDLDGTDDFIQMPHNNYWDSNVFGTATNFTIECWYKPDLFMNWDSMIWKQNPSVAGWYSSTEGAAIWSDVNGFVAVFASGVASNPAGSFVLIYYATTTLKWYHLCFTGDGTTLRFYVDGVQRGTALVASRTVAVTTSSNGPSFGRRDFMNGQLGNVKFYTRHLSDSEVVQNFNAHRSRFGI
jgi:hypothetical protein